MRKGKADWNVTCLFGSDLFATVCLATVCLRLLILPNAIALHNCDDLRVHAFTFTWLLLGCTTFP
jgi:hypothetical protein